MHKASLHCVNAPMPKVFFFMIHPVQSADSIDMFHDDQLIMFINLQPSFASYNVKTLVTIAHLRPKIVHNLGNNNLYLYPYSNFFYIFLQGI